MFRPQHSYRTSSLIILCVLIANSHSAYADGISKILKAIAKAGDDIPMKRIEDAVNNKAIARQGKELLESMSRQADEVVTSRGAMRQLLQKSLGRVDPIMLRQLDEMDDAGKAVALVMSKGADNVQQIVPDLLQRTRFIRDGGPETMASVGRYSDLADDAIRFQTMIDAGLITTTKTGQKVTLQTFGEFFQTTGDRGHQFWTKYVRPHPKKWLAGGALTAVLVTPDEYLDEAGNLAASAIEKLPRELGEIVGKATAAAIKGTGDGLGTIVQQTSQSFFQTFLKSGWAMLGLILCLSGLAIVFHQQTKKLTALLVTGFRKLRPAKSEKEQ